MNNNSIYNNFEDSFLNLSNVGLQPTEVFSFVKWYQMSKDYIKDKMTDFELCVLANSLNGVRYMHKVGPEQIIHNLEVSMIFEPNEAAENLIEKLKGFSDVELLIVMNMAYELLI